MKKVILNIWFIVGCLSIVAAQNHEFQWAKSIGSTELIDGLQIHVDAQGNIYHAGAFTGTADFDPGPDSFILNAIDGTGGFLMKLSPDGEFIWAKSYASMGDQRIYDVHIDAIGNLYAVGRFEGTVNFGDGLGANTLTSMGLSDCFLLKADLDGNTVWVKHFGTLSNENLFDVTTDNWNNIYTVGMYSNAIDADPGLGQTFLEDAILGDSWVLKLDPDGNFEWAKTTASGPGYQWSQKIQVDYEQNIFLTGFYPEVTDLDPSIATAEFTPVGSYDAFFQKLGNDGSLTWARSIGNAEYDLVGPLSLDVFGNMYALGHFYGTVDFDPGVGTHNITSVGVQDVYLLKLSAFGEFEWVKTFGSSYGYRGEVVIDTANYIYTSGLFQDTMNLDFGTTVLEVIADGDADVFYVKLDLDGNLIWYKQVGGSGYDTSRDLELDFEGNLITMGRFAATADLDPGPGETTVTAVADYDIYFSKFGLAVVNIEEVVQDNSSVSIYPNPANQRVFIELEESNQKAICNILNAQGKLVYTDHFGTSSKLSLEFNLASGMYFVEIIAGDSREITKLIIE